MPLFLLAPWTKLTGGKRVLFVMPRNINKGLEYIVEMISKRAFRPVIDRRYTLDQIRDAFEYVATGMKTGNVILTTKDEI